MNTWRRTRNDEWVVVGPPEEVQEGATVRVQSSTGTVREVHIVRVGTPFTTDDGTTLVYGWPEVLPATEKQLRKLNALSSARFGDETRARAALAASRSAIQAGKLSRHDASVLIAELEAMPHEDGPRVRWQKVDDEWLLNGPVEEIVAGADVEVARKDGVIETMVIESVREVRGKWALGVPKRETREHQSESA